MNSNQVLDIQRVEKFYGNGVNLVKALDDISFGVKGGEFVAIMGASGSGKTTLLNCISTIDTVSAGHILVDNRDITTLKSKEYARFRRENLGFVFQDFNLLDHLTIRENIALALSINNVKANIIDGRVDDIAKQLDITDILHHYPHETSGGQKQRCACARAMISNPKITLADEPTGSLDSNTARMLLETLTLLNQNQNTTILMVTHDATAASYTSRVLMLKDGAIFTELYRGDKSRTVFFSEILMIMTALGGNNIENI